MENELRTGIVVFSTIPLIIVLGYMLYYYGNSEMIDNLEDITEAESGYDIERHASKIGVRGLPMPLLIVIGIFAIMHLGPWAGIPMGLWTMAHVCIRKHRYISPIITRHKAQQRLANRNNRAEAQQRQEAFNRPDPNDDFFNFDAKKMAEDFFNDPNSYARSSAKPASQKTAPRGFEQRHASDAKLWAVVDDPNASDAERQAAFSKILKAQAKRKGHFEVEPLKLEWLGK